MELTILDTNLDAIAVVDTYESLIWTERYSKHGDFELYTAVNDDILALLIPDYYITIQDSEYVMIIEDNVIKADPENGTHITTTGKSLESILNRRILWGYVSLDGNLQNGIETLLNGCIIDPTNPDRKIDNFIFDASTDPAITGLTLTAQYSAGSDLYETITKICTENGIGFRITINDNKQFVFKLYAGIDRSYNQFDNPFVVFSPDFENLNNSNFAESKSSYKNVTLVGGEGEGLDRRYASVGSATGLNRREAFIDANDITSDVGDGTSITDEQYTAILQQRGLEELVNLGVSTSFDGEAETSILYTYGKDFFMGDVVQVADEYGHESISRVTELIRSENEGGSSVYPTFENVEEGE